MRRATALTAVVPLLLLAGCSGDVAPEEGSAPAGGGGEPVPTALDGGYSALDPGSVGEAVLTATLEDAEGREIGVVGMDPGAEGTVVSVVLTDSGLEPGFHGFHVHAVGECEPDSQSPSDPSRTGDFLSTGGHLGADASDHPAHAGDLPPLLVRSTGDATLQVVTEGFTVDDVTDADGSAVVVHEGADDFANVPERYAPEGPDEETLSTGDSGGRAACGVLG
ncbi:superoxide dismutase family protein [Pseudokineococcus marinus]|uniref:Superoxide dismutase n=1 Tax=Pseudokineococcus marinus TaxID=351215 RepID=A0A849BYZ9_9ACTN|nr:superoxide dismutase family protein [Pseudokineococcus marinus]NNH22728.1 superoxide dismutase [Pseudokineococcus marinus]